MHEPSSLSLSSASYRRSARRRRQRRQRELLPRPRPGTSLAQAALVASAPVTRQAEVSVLTTAAAVTHDVTAEPTVE